MRLSAPNRRSSTTNLVHDVRRDRSISEIVEGAIEEHQAGTSFMVGLAAAVAGTYGKVAGAAMGVLGHGSNTTSGDRGVEAKTVQQLSDHISQRTSSERSLRSTVVVHSDQAEYETIQTRIVTNCNKGHDWVEKVFEALSAKISEAMNNTWLGLAIAVTCMIGHVFLNAASKKQQHELEAFSMKLENLLAESQQQHTSSARG